MNYKKHYIKLMLRAKNRDNIDGYIEKHHVFPKSIFNHSVMTVNLTAKEHYIAHFLIWKYYKSRFGADYYKTKKMAHAFNQMTWDTGNRYVSNTFCIARRAMALSNTGDSNPAKRKSTREKISASKTGKIRVDLQNKKYFGATDEKISAGIEKMRKTKTGVKTNYPSHRKSAPCSDEKRNKISESRLITKNKFIEMGEYEFAEWIKSCKMYRKDGRKNSNVTRAIGWRNEDIQKYYPDS